MSFRSTLALHLQAIQQRDLETYVSTLTTNPELTLIFPKGNTITARDEVIAFTTDWFSDPDWRMDAREVRVVEGSNMAFALYDVTYNDLGPTGQPYQLQYFLNLIFALEAGEWKLIHDQNTLTRQA